MFVIFFAGNANFWESGPGIVEDGQSPTAGWVLVLGLVAWPRFLAMFAVCKLKTPPADRDKYLHIYLDLLGVEIGPNPLIVPRRSNPLKRSAADSGVESGQRFGDGNLCGLGASKRLAAKVEFFSLSICFSIF